MKLVKFANGTYGIRQGWFFLTYEYLDKRATQFWSSQQAVSRFCEFDTLDEAEQRLADFHYPRRDYGTPI